MKRSGKAMATCLAVMVAMTVVTMSGCKKSNSSAKSANSATVDAKHPITISMFIGDSTTITPTKNNKTLKLLKEKLGINLKYEILSGDLNQKLGVMIAGGDLPDLVTYNLKFQEANDLIPLESKIKKYAPAIYKHFIDGEAWNKMKDSNDGHIYAMPNYGVVTGKATGSYYSGPAFWIQKRILADAGYPKVTTLDQYFSLIQNYLKKNPTTNGEKSIGFETLATNAQAFVLENAPEHLSGHPNDGGVVVDKGVASLFQDKDISKTYYKKLNDMYNAGVVDKEAITQTQDQYLQKIASGRVLGMFDQHWDFQSAENSLLTKKKYDLEYAPLALTYDGVTPHYKDRSVVNLGNGFSITKDCKDPDRVLTALNKLMNEKWMKILNWGIEGEDYSIDKASGQPVWSAQQQTNSSDNAWKAANRADVLYGTLPKIEGTYSDGNATSLGDNPVQYKKGLSAYDKNFLAKYHANSWYDMMGNAPKNEIYYPSWNINIPTNSDASKANTAIGNTELKWLPRVIVAKSSQFDSQWSSYVKEIQSDNPKAYLDAINKGIQYRIKHWTIK